jgi:hypothetical protein
VSFTLCSLEEMPQLRLLLNVFCLIADTSACATATAATATAAAAADLVAYLICWHKRVRERSPVLVTLCSLEGVPQLRFLLNVFRLNADTSACATAAAATATAATAAGF